MSTDAIPLSPSFRRIGRGIVVSLFSVAAGVLAVSVVSSVALSLFGKPPTLHDGALSEDDRNYCVRTLVGLRDELEQEVTLVAAPPRPRVDPAAHWQNWEGTFKTRFDEASAHCVHDDIAMEHAYSALTSMHEGYAIAVTHILDVRATIAPALADVEQLLK